MEDEMIEQSRDYLTRLDASVYKMPDGDWGFMVMGTVSDGYRTEAEAMLYAWKSIALTMEEMLRC